MPVVKRYGMQRDNQRSKLYGAEKVLKARSQRLEKVQDIERFVEKVRKRATLVRRYDRQLRNPIQVKDGRRNRNASANAFEITMPRWARTQYIVCHELAHTIAMRKYGRTAIAPHGREFCAVYIDLIRYMIGKEAADVLKASFAEHGVKWRKRTSV